MKSFYGAVMSAREAFKIEIKLILGLLFFTLLVSALAAGIKVRVTVDNASIKSAPAIESNTLTRVPLNTVLEAELKQGEWYKVSTTKDGSQVTGFIHEMLVIEVGQGVKQTNEGTLDISTDPPRCIIRIDDRFVGISPVEVKLLPGSHRLRIEKQGYKIVETEITLNPYQKLARTYVLRLSTIIKLKVTFPNAMIKSAPEIASNTLARVPIDSVLEATLKQGEWYKVSMTKDGAPVTGFIHEVNVKEVWEAEKQINEKKPIIWLVPMWYESYSKAEAAIGARQWNEAIGYINEALKQKSDSSTRVRTSGQNYITYFPYFKLGIAYYYLGQLDAAMQALSTEEQLGSITKSPIDFAEFQRVRKMITQTKEKGSAELQNRIRQWVFESINQASTFEIRGQLDNAIAAVSRALAVDPEDVDSKLMLSRLQAKVVKAEQSSRAEILIKEGRDYLASSIHKYRKNARSEA